VDITHEIPPGDIRAGAFALAQAAGCFPRGAIHVAVIDPGVGSGRRAIALQTSVATFLGPDNGLLSLAAAAQGVTSARLLENAKLFRQPVSRTFHGRDIFAPVAAHLATGAPFRTVGPPADSFVQLDWKTAQPRSGSLHGEIVFIDRFGNAITNIPETMADPESGSPPLVFLRGRRLCDVRDCYAAVKRGSAVAVFGSTGFLELAVHGGSAANRWRLRPGTKVELRTN
jgi:S-adenosyl-L-methionine hydrolase (adenosine-forming)